MQVKLSFPPQKKGLIPVNLWFNKVGAGLSQKYNLCYILNIIIYKFSLSMLTASSFVTLSC